MKTKASRQFGATKNQVASKVLGLLVVFIVLVASVTLSSCAGYTTNASSGSGSGGGTSGGGTLTPSPASVSFGNVAVGTTATQSIGITNTGTGTATLSGLSMTGGTFSLASGNSTASLSAGQSVTVQVQYAPTSTSTTTGALTVSSNASNSTLAIGLVGTGMQAIPGFSPSSLSFSNITVGQTSSQTVTLNNTGNAGLTVSAATVSGAGFAISGLSLPATVAPNASTTFSVSFTPASASGSTGSVTITDNGPGGSQALALTGTAVAPNGSLTATPGSLDFGNVTVGNTDSQQISLTNNGSSTVTLSQIAVSGTGFGQVGLSTSSTIAPGATLNFNATFAPTSSGSSGGSITLSNSGTPSSLVITLTGSGQAATALLGANPSSLSFGSVLDQTSASQTTSITNNGNSDVTISSVITAGAGFSVSGISNGTVLTPGQSVTLTVTFDPIQGIAVTGASVTVASNATNSPLTVSLSGSGQHSVLVSWGSSTTQGVTYNVFRGTTSGGEDSTPINTAPISLLNFTDVGVTAGQQYFYTVEAVNSAGSSGPSAEASATVPTP